MPGIIAFIFRCNSYELGAVDYFESGEAAPDVILMDLIKAFYPNLLPEHEFVYYQALQ